MTEPSANSASFGKRPAEAERRQLTVLFCDLVDSTGLSRRLDAEDYRELVLNYQTAAAAVIERYEGHIAQYLGDGLLVYFGHPVAQDDDAERAVRCGYELQQALARLDCTPPLQVRVGIHTGSAVVGQMGGAGRQEMLAMGDTSNFAARLQVLAEPGMVLISDTTMRLVRGLVVTCDLGPRSLKGFDTAVRVHQVIQPSGVRTRLEAAERLTPFVNREAELALLDDRWHQVLAGEGQALHITGEPGLGKSRLLLMVHARMQETAHSWLECRASPMTRHSAYQPIVDLLQQGLQLREGDSAEIKLQRLEQALETTEVELPEAVPLLAPLLNLPLPARYPPSPYGAELKRDKTMDCLITWVLTLARFQPLVLVLEDLHWLDPSSLQLLTRLLERLPGTRILALMTSRPEFHPGWPPRANVVIVGLRPLPRRQVVTMLDSLTQNKALPEAVASRIQERANGVPLFVEEITKQLLESGQLLDRGGQLELSGSLDQLAIPETLQDSLMARLDKQGEAKGLAQVCAVIGRDIPYRLLAHVSELDEATLQQQLRQLTQAELLYQRGRPPASSYVFKHALIRDTAYGSLLKSARQKLHGRIATTLEQHFRERTRAEPAVLAEHFDKAGLVEKAVRYYQLAGEGAVARTAVSEAIGLFEKALALLPRLPESSARTRQELALLAALIPWVGTVRGYAHASVRAALDRARSLFAEGTDPFVQTIVLGYSHISYQFAGEYQRALRSAEETMALGQSLHMPILERNGHASAALSYYWLGRFDETLASVDRALRIPDLPSDEVWARMSGVDAKAMALLYRAWTRCMMGYPDEARALTQQAIARAESLGAPMVLCIVLIYGPPTIARMLHDADALYEASSRALASVERYGYTDGRLWASVYFGLALAMRGQLDEGLGLLRRSIEGREAHGTLISLQWDYLDMSRLLLAAGRVGEARAALQQAAALNERFRDGPSEAEQHRTEGELLLAEGAGDARAEACFQRALAVARAQGARLLELRAALSLARLWQRQRRDAEAWTLLQPLYGSFSEGFDTPDLRAARELLARLRH